MKKRNLLRLFQFHKGTIKTGFQYEVGKEYENFNSIKVQLKPVLADPAFAHYRFQFHKGTIKTHHNTD